MSRALTLVSNIASRRFGWLPFRVGIIVLALPEEQSAKGLAGSEEGNTLKCRAIEQPTGLVPLVGLLLAVALSTGGDETRARSSIQSKAQPQHTRSVV